jgi:hypothetical protein
MRVFIVLMLAVATLSGAVAADPANQMTASNTTTNQTANGTISVGGVTIDLPDDRRPEATPTPATSTPTATPAPERVASVDPTLSIVSWRFDSDASEMVIVFRAKVPERVSIADALADTDARGWSEMPAPTERTLQRGETTVRVPVETVNGDAAVIITSDDGRGSISTGVGGGRILADRPPLQAWVGGSVVGLGLFVGFGYWGWRRAGSKPRPARRP